MTIAFAILIAAGIAVPHAVRLDRATPLLAATIWASALALRAVTAVGVALFIVFWFPATELFQLVTHWCWHRAVPFVAVHLGLNGHSIGDVATVLPATLLAASLLSVIFGLWRAARRVHNLLLRGALGPGPRRSVIIRDGEVMVPWSPSTTRSSTPAWSTSTGTSPDGIGGCSWPRRSVERSDGSCPGPPALPASSCSTSSETPTPTPCVTSTARLPSPARSARPRLRDRSPSLPLRRWPAAGRRSVVLSSFSTARRQAGPRRRWACGCWRR